MELKIHSTGFFRIGQVSFNRTAYGIEKLME